MQLKSRVVWTLQGDPLTPPRRVEFVRWLPLNLQMVRIDHVLVSTICNPLRRHQLHHLTIGPWRAYVESAAPGMPDPTLMIAGRLIPSGEPFDLTSLATVT